MNDIIQTWFPVVSALVAGMGVAAAFWFRATAKDEAETTVAAAEARCKTLIDGVCVDVKGLEMMVQQDRERLIKVEGELHALPQQRDFVRMNENVLGVAGDIKRLVAEVTNLKEGGVRTEAAIRVINETLMSRNS